MERPVRRLFVFFVLLFLALVVQLTYVQVWAAPKLKTNPSNTRAVEEEMKIERGTILSSDGMVLATNRKDGDYYTRVYPQGALTSPWLGYNSLRYGRAGLERVYSEQLAGQADVLTLRNYLDLLTGKPRRGANLRLTLDTKLQRVAADALGNRKGAVVALDPRTGAVLAMVSWPRYDPNNLDSQWKSLNTDPNRPLVNRAASGLYPPGSAFKVVVAGAALQQGLVTPGSNFDDSGTYTAGGFKVKNYGDKVYGKHDFAQALAQSINTTFAKVGVQLGGVELAQYAGGFGFGMIPPWLLGGAKSVFPSPDKMDVAHVAQASFGQGAVLATPLEMALTAAGIANGGRIMRPYLVAEMRDYRGVLLEKARSQVWEAPLSEQTAATLRDLMVGVVEHGTGTGAALQGVKVAGKTGTAEVASGRPHAWFIGFAPAQQPGVAVAVIVENAGTGGAVAAPVARRVMAAALGL